MSYDAFASFAKFAKYGFIAGTVGILASACLVVRALSSHPQGCGSGLDAGSPNALWARASAVEFEHLPAKAARLIEEGVWYLGQGLAFGAYVLYALVRYYVFQYVVPLTGLFITFLRTDVYEYCRSSTLLRGSLQLFRNLLLCYLCWRVAKWAWYNLVVVWTRQVATSSFPTQIEKSIPSGTDFIGLADPGETVEVTPESLLGAADFMVQGGYPLGMVELQTFISLEGKTRISNPAGCGIVLKHNGLFVLTLTKHQAAILLSALRAGGEVWVLGNAGKMQLPPAASVAFRTSDAHDVMGLVVSNVFCSVVGVKPAELRLHRAATGTVAVYRRNSEGKLLYSIGEMTRVGNTIQFHHSCNTENHTSGSPVYLISGGRITVFGIHRGAVVGKAANIGTSLEFLLLPPKAASPVKVESEGYYAVGVPGSFWDDEATYFPNQKFYEEDDSDLYDHEAYTRPSGGMGIYDETKRPNKPLPVAGPDVVVESASLSENYLDQPDRVADFILDFGARSDAHAILKVLGDRLRPAKPLPIPCETLDELEELECRPEPPPKPLSLQRLSSAVAFEQLKAAQKPPKVRVESTSGSLNSKSPQPGEGSPLTSSVNTSSQNQPKLSPKASASGKLVAQPSLKDGAVSQKGTNSSGGSKPSRSKARKSKKSKTGSSASASQ